MKNMGNPERIIRLAIGIIIIGLGVYYKSWWGVIGLLPVLSAATGYCFLNTLFGKGCCSSEKKEAASKGDHHDHGGCCGHKH